jgi:hypothetical protein
MAECRIEDVCPGSLAHHRESREMVVYRASLDPNEVVTESDVFVAGKLPSPLKVEQKPTCP